MDFKVASAAIHEEIQLATISKSPLELYEPVNYILSLGGKRMRPMLVLMGSYLFSNDWQTAVKPSLAVELFHNFTLMHDDIMDDAPLRRGKPTVHTKWDGNTAILSGDAMMIKAYDFLDDLPAENYKKAVQLFNKTAVEVCEGQQYDMNFETREDVSEVEYLEMIRLKTAVLLGFSLELGALLGGANEADCQAIYQFGEDIGIGFQLKDDILDVYGDSAQFGKQVGGDILANKKTFLLIEALEKANTQQRSLLTYWLTRDSFDPQEKVDAVTAIYNEIGVKKLAEEKMNAYFEKGFQGLANIDIDEERKANLKAFSIDILNRIK